MPLVSVGLPVYNGVERIEAVVRSVLAQDHSDLELVISDNASTDGTEDLCRSLAVEDPRIVYHRNPVNVGLLNNFVGALRLGRGEFFRWVGDDDWLAPNCVSRGLDVFAADPGLMLVTSQVDYTAPDGVTSTMPYDGTAFRSDDPVVRLTEMLRLLNQSHLIIDPLYGMVRREPVARIERRNMLREDEVFATKLALAGRWGHVPEVLAKRNWKHESPSILARRPRRAQVAGALRDHFAVPGDGSLGPGLAGPVRRPAPPGVVGDRQDVRPPPADRGRTPRPQAGPLGPRPRPALTLHHNPPPRPLPSPCVGKGAFLHSEWRKAALIMDGGGVGLGYAWKGDSSR